MIPYYKELENPNEFNLYLRDIYSDDYRYVYDAKIPDSFYEKYDDLLKEVKLLPFLISITSFERFPFLSYDEWLNLGNFISMIEQETPYEFFEGREPIVRNVNDELNLLRWYYRLSDGFLDFYPEYKDKLEYIKKKSRELIDELNKRTIIKLDPEKYVCLNWTNAWFITPSNVLYNTGGIDGHKGGNFVNLFNELVLFSKKDKKIHIPSFDFFDEMVDRILKDGYVSYGDFKNYSNLKYHFINIETDELKRDRQRQDRYFEYLNENERKNGPIEFEEVGLFYDDFFNGNTPVLERSYQKNIITLVIGYLKAKKDYYDSLSRLNSSNRTDIVKELLEMVDYNLKDFLVRFCGFSSIESCIPKTIVTSRITAYEDFHNYLEKGWNIYLLPPILYDSENDKLKEISLYSPSVYHYLVKEGEKNSDLKGKVIPLEKIDYIAKKAKKEMKYGTSIYERKRLLNNLINNKKVDVIQSGDDHIYKYTLDGNTIFIDGNSVGSDTDTIEKRRNLIIEDERRANYIEKLLSMIGIYIPNIEKYDIVCSNKSNIVFLKKGSSKCTFIDFTNDLLNEFGISLKVTKLDLINNSVVFDYIDLRELKHYHTSGKLSKYTLDSMKSGQNWTSKNLSKNDLYDIATEDTPLQDGMCPYDCMTNSASHVGDIDVCDFIWDNYKVNIDKDNKVKVYYK